MIYSLEITLNSGVKKTFEGVLIEEQFHSIFLADARDSSTNIGDNLSSTLNIFPADYSSPIFNSFSNLFKEILTESSNNNPISSLIIKDENDEIFYNISSEKILNFTLEIKNLITFSNEKYLTPILIFYIDRKEE